MIGDGVAPLTQESPGEGDCPAKDWACSWCPFRGVCKDRNHDDCYMENCGDF